MSTHDDLLETLRQAQRFGFFGGRAIEEAVSHAEQYVAAIGELTRSDRLLDLGSGGGLPGLVLAAAWPEADIVLLDRRQKRTDFLELAVRRLGFEHVEVWCRDAVAVADEVERGIVAPFDVVTARGFGPPAFTLTTARRCLAPDGRIVISEPPSGDRWPTSLLADLDLIASPRAGVRVFHPRSPSQT